MELSALSSDTEISMGFLSSWVKLLPFLLLNLCIFQQNWFVFSISSSKVHIVYMGHNTHSHPEVLREKHHGILSQILGSKEAAAKSIVYSYKHGFSGFAAVLTPLQASSVADLAGVVCVIPNRILQLHTTRSWDFLQVKPRLVNGILSKSQSGVGSIIGVFDSGVWPESRSFNDVGMKKPPSRWKGVCQQGHHFNESNCNSKIIGARWYVKGYEAEFGDLDTSDGSEFLSPRDAYGHGTHTSSTAAGALVEDTSFFGLARGLARGGASSSHIAVYKVCWATGGCSSADILAAFDDSIHDGVDVISVSLGTGPPFSTYLEDPLAIGSFHAVACGITVVCSCGNFGPYPQTVTNTAPWVITVAASTIDRAFPTLITLGNNQTFMGQAFVTGKDFHKFYPLVYGEDIVADDADEDDARSCEAGSLNASLATGAIVLCFQSLTRSLAASTARNVQEVGGVAIIFAQYPTKDVTLTFAIPCVQIDFSIGTSLVIYAESNSNPVVKISTTRTVVGKQTSPEVAFFSARGPSSLSPTVLKPDVAAPGVNILASWSPAASSAAIDQNRVPLLDFKLESGTSMACPHVSGIVALLKSMHPTWSPAAIKSALVTTASVEDENGLPAIAEGAPHKHADPFDYGGGHVDPNKAINPGLVYNMTTADYVRFLCAMGYNDSAISSLANLHSPCSRKTNFLRNLNLPSISIPELRKSITVTRMVTNVNPTTTPSVYVARIEAPPGTKVRVAPSILIFNSTKTRLKFRVTICPMVRVEGRFSFGNLYWEDGVHVVRTPLVVHLVIHKSYSQI
ncbi:subtilisin-like protease SBT3.9 [Cynara cardunculus var. scolymus]|uniref:subtilisin-like protease SBT3.9 n=1 Tax=Cynara cardunculus var. scolymus TaxID=59895 RepID=UPI000D6272A5|nr:subtilisin-like protease SBT3.9 [Cynara cardunculus var. scolymus]